MTMPTQGGANERSGLAALAGQRLLFEAIFQMTGQVHGTAGATCFAWVGPVGGGLGVADHIWVWRTWPHLKRGDLCRFFATVTPYWRGDGSAGWSLEDITCLEVVANFSEGRR